MREEREYVSCADWWRMRWLTVGFLCIAIVIVGGAHARCTELPGNAVWRLSIEIVKPPTVLVCVCACPHNGLMCSLTCSDSSHLLLLLLYAT